MDLSDKEKEIAALYILMRQQSALLGALIRQLKAKSQIDCKVLLEEEKQIEGFLNQLMEIKLNSNLATEERNAQVQEKLVALNKFIFDL